MCSNHFQVLGQGGDFDAVALPSAPSAADYARELEGEL